jgi:hypothetical protein
VPQPTRCDIYLNFDTLAEGKAMSNLASTYDKLGMHEDALALRAETLGHFRRVLPDDHPDIGQSLCALALHNVRGCVIRRAAQGTR